MNKDYIKNIEGAERRFFTSEVRAEKREDAADELAVIEGYAAKFNSETVIGYFYQFREMIEDGAFDDVLKDDVRCLFNHDPNQILARSKDGKGTLELMVDAIGLQYRYKTPDRSYARDLANAIENGDVSQSSFAFEIEHQEWVEVDGEIPLRKIKKFKRLYDVSPVTYPAYADTEVAKRSHDAYVDEIKKRSGENPSDDKGLTALEAQIKINENYL